MLVGKRQGFDVQDLRHAQQTVEINTQRMRGQLTIQTGAQAPKRMSIVFLDAQLPRQLPIDRFNQLTDAIVPFLELARHLLFLVGPRHGAQGNPMMLPQLGRLDGANVGFVRNTSKSVCSLSRSTPAARSGQLAGVSSKSKISPRIVMTHANGNQK